MDPAALSPLDEEARAAPLVTASAAYYSRERYAQKAQEYRFGGMADRMKFAPYLRPEDRVLDFGCRGGYLLSNLTCRDRMGIEPDQRYRSECAAAGITAVASPDEVPDHWADVLISHHVLEHVPTPFETLRRLRRTIRPGGTAVFVVPCESIRTAYREDDPHDHLFTWSPLNLGNLFTAAGYRVLMSRACFHRWPPKGILIQRWFGWQVFHALAQVYGRAATKLSQSMVVATPLQGAP